MYRSSILLAALTLPILGCNSSSPTTTDVPQDDDTASIISSDNAETVLREVIAIANDEALDTAAARIEPIFSTVENLVDHAIADGVSSGNGLSFVSSAPITDGGGLSEYTFACDSGGTLVVQAYKDESLGGPYIDEMRAADACSIDDATYEGFAYRSVSFVRNANLATFEHFSISHANGDSMLLNGQYYDSSTEGSGPAVRISWTDASLALTDQGETITVEDYSSQRDSLVQTSIPDSGAPGATASASFSVTAPWTSGETWDVTLELAYVDDIDAVPNERGWYSAQWQTGSLQVTAADGSNLTLSPETGDTNTFSLVVDGALTDPMIFNWADGFQVLCAPDFECL